MNTVLNKSTYKGWSIAYYPKPIPTQLWDWEATHEDYDGENGLHFVARSEEAIKEGIDEWDWEERDV